MGRGYRGVGGGEGTDHQRPQKRRRLFIEGCRRRLLRGATVRAHGNWVRPARNFPMAWEKRAADHTASGVWCPACAGSYCAQQQRPNAPRRTQRHTTATAAARTVGTPLQPRSPRVRTAKDGRLDTHHHRRVGQRGHIGLVQGGRVHHGGRQVAARNVRRSRGCSFSCALRRREAGV